MKRIIIYILVFAGIPLMPSCIKDILTQESAVNLPDAYYWNTPDDALSATYGVYVATRTLFGRDYYFDGMGEFQWTRGTSLGSGTWHPQASSGSSFGFMWNNAYTVINRANYVQKNLQLMIAGETNTAMLNSLKRIDGEVRFLRALAYFRLMELWGDVPFYTGVLAGNDEAVTLTRTPISAIKDSLVKDLTYAIETLPPSLTSSELGRASQAAAYGFRGKIQLYWASWKKNGWPELQGFTQDAAEAATYYARAAEDFGKVIYDYNLRLFSEGDPGTYQNPKYWELFQVKNEYASEIIFSVQYGGPNLSQGQELQRDYGTRSTGNAQCWVQATSRLADRYQSLTTGDFANPVILNSNATLEGGARNPDTYKDRDWRMKATIMWDGQKMLRLDASGYVVGDSITFKLGSTDGNTYINYDSNPMTGYLFRKWVRQEGIAERSDGPCDFYLMRLADVYLMYCEAVNEVSGPNNDLVALVDKIRARGNLPGLAPGKYATAAAFFDAIEQERIVELAAEGHRPFDIRRWRKVETIWPAPTGQVLRNTDGTRIRDEFLNVPERDYQRFYIYQIPTGERERNPGLTQNTPWL
ncbi:MAG: RagB/SusD family nutrient uptake outer membrane protein [Bacteroidales bacterium]|jgi:hypothetical protein|nr:RagB/SusD family nutrient uptake outer membrane protein [Bacteroidales bacterium]